MLSRWMRIKKEREETLRPLLKLPILELCKPIWNNAQIIEHIKLATTKDAMLEPILAFFMNGPDRARVNIHQWFQAYHFSNGILQF